MPDFVQRGHICNYCAANLKKNRAFVMPRGSANFKLHKMVDPMNRYEMFPNGHPQFLTKASKDKILQVRASGTFGLFTHFFSKHEPKISCFSSKHAHLFSRHRHKIPCFSSKHPYFSSKHEHKILCCSSKHAHLFSKHAGQHTLGFHHGVLSSPGCSEAQCNHARSINQRERRAKRGESGREPSTPSGHRQLPCS